MKFARLADTDQGKYLKALYHAHDRTADQPWPASVPASAASADFTFRLVGAAEHAAQSAVARRRVRDRSLCPTGDRHFSHRCPRGTERSTDHAGQPTTRRRCRHHNDRGASANRPSDDHATNDGRAYETNCGTHDAKGTDHPEDDDQTAAASSQAQVRPQLCLGVCAYCQ